MSEKNPRRGIVLSGGGANGAYEVGAMKAIFGGKSPATGGEPVEADIFTGTSVGSFNAAFMVSETAGGEKCEQANEELEKAWVDKIAEYPEGCNNGAFRIRADFLDYLDPRCFLNDPMKPFQELAEDSMFFAQEAAKRGMAFFTGKGPLAQRAVEFVDIASALSTTPLHDLVVDSIDLDAVLSPNAKTLNVIATNWDLGKVSVFTNRADYTSDSYRVREITQSNGHKAVLASTAIPGVFPPAKIASEGGGSYYYVDGGVLMNTPLSPAIQSGAREIHVIYFEPKLDKLPDDYLPSTLDTTNRFLYVLVASLVRADIEQVRDVNRQAAIADRIKPIVETLEKEHKADLAKKGQELKRAVGDAKAFIDRLAKREQVVVHNHYPSKSLGGLLSLLNFKRDRMLELVDLGYDDTVAHDCEKNRCVLAEN